MTDIHAMEEEAARKALEYVQELIAAMVAVCDALNQHSTAKNVRAVAKGLSTISPSQFRSDRHD